MRNTYSHAVKDKFHGHRLVIQCTLPPNKTLAQAVSIYSCIIKTCACVIPLSLALFDYFFKHTPSTPWLRSGIAPMNFKLILALIGLEEAVAFVRLLDQTLLEVSSSCFIRLCNAIMELSHYSTFT